MTEVALDMLMYLIFAGLMQAVLTAGLAIAGMPLLLPRGWRVYRAFVTRVLLFSALLYAWGCLGDGLFVAAFRDRIYVNRDSIGDFIPWFPSTRYMVDTACGGHPINGATWNTLRLAWVAVAAPVWLAAFWSYARFMRLRGDSRIAHLPAAESR
ncbi:MAG TPA: hypothetical protein VLB76_25775 [Thermoanaerobaculia bacterium]|jgi:hypothetical protein|nr:hypothetical protein [Thermoanaerobaculia bacterium]